MRPRAERNTPSVDPLSWRVRKGILLIDIYVRPYSRDQLTVGRIYIRCRPTAAPIYSGTCGLHRLCRVAHRSLHNNPACRERELDTEIHAVCSIVAYFVLIVGEI